MLTPGRYQQQDDDSAYGPSARQTSVSAPFEFDSYIPPAAQPLPEAQPLRSLTQAELSAFIHPQANPAVLLYTAPPPDLPAPSPLGLPVYSASGFDLLSILARVANRPHPRVHLGPVDLTCSFVVVDVRRFDHSIVYCSPTFCRLTGYSEHEVIGRNCRFLQAPNGQVHRGETRHFTDQTAVAHLKKNLSADKECQTSIVNYKKDGTAFINLVTVIPILGGVSGLPHEEFDVVYHVGFQVDLTEQPNAILEKLRDGSYLVDYAAHSRNQILQPPSLGPSNVHLRDRKSQVIPSVRISRDLKKLLADPAFVKSIPVTSSTTVPSSHTSSSVRPETDSHSSFNGHSQLLHLMLLEALPDFIHVVSLKGNFLYVAPSVRRVLGYEPDEMVGKSLSDYAHPEDVVPLMRELKEGSATGLATMSTSTLDDGGGSGPGGGGGGGSSSNTSRLEPISSPVVTGLPMAPRSVDLLFRARTKVGVYVWIECKGRLHVEPGKGRKAIILSGRAKEMPNLDWHSIAKGGGLSLPVTKMEGSCGVGGKGDDEMRRSTMETEVWGTMSSGACAGGVASFLVVGSGMPDVLGWSCSELVGREVAHLMVDGVHQFNEELRVVRGREGMLGPSPSLRRVLCKMRHKNGTAVDVVFVMYRSRSMDRGVFKSNGRESMCGIISAPLIYQIRTLSSSASSSSSLSSFTSFTSSSSSFSSSPLTTTATSFVHSLDAGVFEELETTRDSSWQYEIQQVRFANQRLEEEIVGLRKQLEEVGERRKKVREVRGEEGGSVCEEEGGGVCEEEGGGGVCEDVKDLSAVLDCYVPSVSTKFAMHHSAGPLHLDFDLSSSSSTSSSLSASSLSSASLSERLHRPYTTAAAVAETRHHELVPDYAMAAIPSYVSQFSTLASFSAREWEDSAFFQQQQQQQQQRHQYQHQHQCHQHHQQQQQQQQHQHQQSRIQGLKRSWDLIHK